MQDINVTSSLKFKGQVREYRKFLILQCSASLHREVLSLFNAVGIFLVMIFIVFSSYICSSFEKITLQS